MGCHGSGIFTAGNTLQKSTLEAIAKIDKRIDNMKAKKAEVHSWINDIIRFTPPNERDEWDKRNLAEYRGYLKEYNAIIDKYEEEKKKIRKAGREESKGQLTFFSMRNSK